MEPAASCTSCLVTDKIALAIMRLDVSPIPIGRTPGFLFRAIRRLARRGAILFGSTNSVHKRRAVRAMEWQSSNEADLKDVQSRLQLRASRPDGPAAPLVCRAADLIVVTSIDSKRTGWTSRGLSPSYRRISAYHHK